MLTAHVDPLDLQVENSEDILSDALSFLGGAPVHDSDEIQYGPLVLTIAPKEGKANTLLADKLFSPALFLAERVERGLLTAPGLTVAELGAGTALPSLMLSSQPSPPSLIVVTDYPDDIILGNLRKNLERNRGCIDKSCTVRCAGYAWGTDPQPILDILPDKHKGFDVVIMSDLLHFDSFHDILVRSAVSLLAKTSTARLHIAVGKYTQPHVCDSFFAKAKHSGLEFEDILSDQQQWFGKLEVSGLDNEALSLRKAACHYWIGHWCSPLEH